MSHNLQEDLHDPNLFDEERSGEYEYEQNELGKSASGYLVSDDDPERDAKAQREAGGEERRGNDHEWGADDGGHLIGARFGGATGEENLTAQARNLNRSGYKHMENEWAGHIKAGDKVYVHVETLGSDRPTAYMGYAIYEHADGSRDYETFSYNNEGKDQVAAWEEDFDAWEAEHPEEAAELYGSDYLGDAAYASTHELSDAEQEYGIEEDPTMVGNAPKGMTADEYMGSAVESGQDSSAGTQVDSGYSQSSDQSMDE